MRTEKSLGDVCARLEGIADELKELQRTQPREYLNVEEAAAFMGLSKIQLDMWRTKTPGGPAWCKVGRRVLYCVNDLRTYMQAHRREPLA